MANFIVSAPHKHRFDKVLDVVHLRDHNGLRVWRQCFCGALDCSVIDVTHEDGKPLDDESEV